tara:strand:+ start:1206 stop:1442 length:237 start_codon:yes stop_codon:yes gene_type:complete
LRKTLGSTLFFGSFVVYGLVLYVATLTEWPVSERLGLGGVLYGISWGAFALGSILLGPEFLERIKKIIKLPTKISNKD